MKFMVGEKGRIPKKNMLDSDSFTMNPCSDQNMNLGTPRVEGEHSKLLGHGAA